MSTGPRPASATPRARVAQVALGALLSVISVVLLVPMHRLELDLLGIDLPVGLVFGFVFQLVASIFAYSSTGSRLPLVILGALWGLLVMPFAGRGIGGGVLMPAEMGEQTQYSGLLLQAIGVLTPFAVAGVITLIARKRAT